MEASFISRARTAINSAAAKAEKVFTDIKKSDSHSSDFRDLDKQYESAPESPKDAGELKDFRETTNEVLRLRPRKTTKNWNDRIRNIRIGKKGAEDSENSENSEMAYAIFDENLYMMGEREFSRSKDAEEEVTAEGSKSAEIDIVPSSAILKQLAVAVESGGNYSSMKDLLASSRGSSPIRERAGVSFSAVKSLVLREKEDKIASEFGSDEKVVSAVNALINAEGRFARRTLSGLEAQINAATLIRDIHGAPVESFVVKISEAVGYLKTLRKMASLWSRVVAELRRLWYEGQYIPGIPPDDIPDLNSCLLHQQLQVINCCISRKRRRTAAIDALESVAVQGSSHAEAKSARDFSFPMDHCFYAKTMSGELVLRLGADKECNKLTMLETGELVYSPVLQEPPLLTEDLIKETEEFVLRTGSVGAGCSQLLSDMQAFKAANPGCILEDFVRWHSPPDWTESDSGFDLDGSSDVGDVSSGRGQLSRRMQKEGNLWRELWQTSKPVPAVRQSPLYDEDLAVEGILDFLDEISPSDLFKQLFIAVLASGLVIAEATLSTNPSLSDVVIECKNYIVRTCQGSTWVEKLDDICQVYETVETMLQHQKEMVNAGIPAEEISDAVEKKNRFKKLSSIFVGKNKSSSKTPRNAEENSVLQPFSSIFSKKPPKPLPSPSDKPSGSVENDWTIV